MSHLAEPSRRTASLAIAATIGCAAAPARSAEGVWTIPQPDPSQWDPKGFPVRESWAQGPNGRVYVRTYGAPSERTPAIILHGGPAGGLRYMLPYAALARDRQIAFYDQSGCGRSAAPSDLALYTVPRYVKELEDVRAHLGFDRPILVGHSWGGFLAPAYAAAYPRRVRALVLAGSAVDMASFRQAAERWLQALGPNAMEVAADAARTGRMDAPAFKALKKRYYGLHNCRLNPVPTWLIKHGRAEAKNPVYRHLNGPNEFQFNGALRELDMRPQLEGLDIPVLVTCGEWDEAAPWVGRELVAAIGRRRGQLLVFKHLSHESHVEDPHQVTTATAAFLNAAAP